MKKLKNLILLVSILFISCTKAVSADSISFKGDKEFSSSEFSVIIEINTTDKVAGIQFPLEYDESKVVIEPTLKGDEANPNCKSKPLQNIYFLTVPSGSKGNILLDGYQTKTGTFDAIELVVQATDNFKIGESTTITLKDGIFANLSGKDWTVKGASFTVKRVEQTSSDPGTGSGGNGSGGTGSDPGLPNDPNTGGGSGGTGEPNTGGGNNSNQNGNNITNPDTGISVPITILIIAVGASIGIYIKNKYSKKLFKL